MYQAHYINPLFQFGKKKWRLVLTDDSGQYPELWIEKEFWENTTRAYMTQYANTQIANYLSSLEEPQSQDPIIPTIDLPAGEELD